MRGVYTCIKDSNRAIGFSLISINIPCRINSLSLDCGIIHLSFNNLIF